MPMVSSTEILDELKRVHGRYLLRDEKSGDYQMMEGDGKEVAGLSGIDFRMLEQMIKESRIKPAGYGRYTPA